MTYHISTKLICALFFGALLSALSLITPANAEACTPHDQVCNGHPTCDPADSTKHCRDTLKSDGYHCECRTGKDNKPHHGGPDISIGIGIGPGGGLGVGIGPEGGIGFDFSTGGYCDRWGCPGDYWGYPVFYGPVYFDGEWFEGPVYYREYDGEYEYWVHGDWHHDQWRGERPKWAREFHYGPALGHDYYKSDEFRNEAERYHRGDHSERSNSDHHFQPEAGIEWKHDRGDHKKGEKGDHPKKDKKDKGDHHGAGDNGDH